MKIFDMINRKIAEKVAKKHNEAEMARFYRIEYGSEWKRCENMHPNYTDNEIAVFCFFPRFN